MRITYNIVFFFNTDRIIYLLKIINEIKKYKYKTDIFIHTNKIFQINNMINYDNKLEMIHHDLSNINPKKLTWLAKTYMKNFIDNYDIFIYSEDDMLIYNEAFNYWLNYKDICFQNKYNIGFLRIEYLDSKKIYLTDISSNFDKPKFKTLQNIKFLVNNKNPYYACWIYDKNIMKKYIQSVFYNQQKLNLEKRVYDIRASQGIGYHAKNMDYFKETLIPLNGINQINNNCYIHHLPNNYINKDSKYGKLLIKDLFN